MGRVSITDTAVEVDGVPLEGVQAFQLTWQRGQVPRLLLDVVGDIPAEVEAVLSASKTTPGASMELERITKAFAALSPEKVEAKALEALGWGDGGSMTSAIIKAIEEKVFGSEPDISAKGDGTPAAG